MGQLDFTSPEFLTTKVASFKAYIISVPKNKPLSIYDLIIGIESLTKMGIILDFTKKKLSVDHRTLPMRPHNQLLEPKVLQAQFQLCHKNQFQLVVQLSVK